MRTVWVMLIAALLAGCSLLRSPPRPSYLGWEWLDPDYDGRLGPATAARQHRLDEMVTVTLYPFDARRLVEGGRLIRDSRDITTRDVEQFKRWMSDMSIDFPPGAEVKFYPETHELVMTNTVRNLQRCYAVFREMSSPPIQVRVTAFLVALTPSQTVAGSKAFVAPSLKDMQRAIGSGDARVIAMSGCLSQSGAEAYTAQGGEKENELSVMPTVAGDGTTVMLDLDWTVKAYSQTKSPGDRNGIPLRFHLQAEAVSSTPLVITSTGTQETVADNDQMMRFYAVVVPEIIDDFGRETVPK